MHLYLLLTATNVYAGGPRLDYPSDSTEEGADCWVDGYDAGFAGKYDADKADECANVQMKMTNIIDLGDMLV